MGWGLCTVIGADDACGGMWTAWAGAAVTGSPSVGVIVASPWTVRRRWWRPVGSAQVVVGSVIEWRRMAWSPGVISSHRSVPLWTAHSRGRSRNPLRSGVVRCCGGSSIVVMGWVRGSVRGCCMLTLRPLRPCHRENPPKMRKTRTKNKRAVQCTVHAVCLFLSQVQPT